MGPFKIRLIKAQFALFLVNQVSRRKCPVKSKPEKGLNVNVRFFVNVLSRWYINKTKHGLHFVTEWEKHEFEQEIGGERERASSLKFV